MTQELINFTVLAVFALLLVIGVVLLVVLVKLIAENYRRQPRRSRWKKPQNPGYTAMAVAGGMVVAFALAIRSGIPVVSPEAREKPFRPQVGVNLLKAYSLKTLPEVRAYALQLVNQDRAANGLPPLVPDPLLDQVAQYHAQDMLNRGYFAHNSPDGKTPRDRYLMFGGSQYVGVGENLSLYQDLRVPGMSYELTWMFQEGWMKSPGHRQNILRPQFVSFGYGVVYGPGAKQLAVQMFSIPPRN
jgi:uncharacterized protein YkwD